MLAYGAPEGGKVPGWQTVVGVVEDARYREVEAPRFDLYLPYRQAPNQVQHFMVRVSGDPLHMVAALRTAVAAIDSDARLDGVSTMEDVVSRAFAPWRFSSIVLAVGVLTAWMLRRSVESMLFGVTPGDALTFAGVPLLLGVVSVLSAYLPARRAACIDPAAALRTE
jgi:hypothetical protein